MSHQKLFKYREKKNTEWFIYTKIFQICVHFKKRCRFVFYTAKAFIWGITCSYTTSVSFLYLCGSCLARIIGKTRPRPFWWPLSRSDYGVGGKGVYIWQVSFAQIVFVKVDLKGFPMEQSLSWIIYRFSWAIQIRCWKPHFEIRIYPSRYTG